MSVCGLSGSYRNPRNEVWLHLLPHDQGSKGLKHTTVHEPLSTCLGISCSPSSPLQFLCDACLRRQRPFFDLALVQAYFLTNLCDMPMAPAMFPKTSSPEPWHLSLRNIWKLKLRSPQPACENDGLTRQAYQGHPVIKNFTLDVGT